MIIKNKQNLDVGTNLTAQKEGNNLHVRYTKGGRSHLARLGISSSPARITGIEQEGFNHQVVVLGECIVRVNGLEVGVSIG